MRSNPAAAFDTGYVIESSGCWIWVKATSDRGYGVLRVFGRQTRAHRYAYERFVGHIEEGMFICHTCDNPRCVNPDHLYAGTPLENSLDMVAKRRQSKKITPEQAALIRADTRPDPEIAADYGISKSQVCCIQRGRRWKHV